MNLVYLISSGAFLLTGLVGCVIPVIPGPVLAYGGLLLMIPSDRPPSVFALVSFGVLVALAVVMDYVVPALGAKKFECSKWGVWGCTVGTVIGMFFLPIGLLPVGLLLGPFLGAFVGELLAKKPVGKALYGGLGAFLGFLSGVFLKIVVCLLMIACYVLCLLSKA